MPPLVHDAPVYVAACPPWLVQWPLISGANLTSPRTEVPLGSDGSEANLGSGTAVQGLVRADGYKLIIGELGQNIWCVRGQTGLRLVLGGVGGWGVGGTDAPTFYALMSPTSP